MNVTDSEYKVLRALRTNHYGDAGETETWTSCINDADEPSGITGKSLSGVIASLNKKGLVKSYEDGRDSTVCLTNEGRKIADGQGVGHE